MKSPEAPKVSEEQLGLEEATKTLLADFGSEVMASIQKNKSNELHILTDSANNELISLLAERCYLKDKQRVYSISRPDGREYRTIKEIVRH